MKLNKKEQAAVDAFTKELEKRNEELIFRMIARTQDLTKRNQKLGDKLVRRAGELVIEKDI